MVIKKRRESGGYKGKKGILVVIKKRRVSGGYKEKKGAWWI